MNADPFPGLAVELEPATFIEDAARDEIWSASDWQDCEKMLRQACQESLEVKLLQRDAGGLYAYDSPYVNFEGVTFQQGPRSRCSKHCGSCRALLRHKHDVTRGA